MGEVIYLVDAVMERHSKAMDECSRLEGIVIDLSKQEKDKFVAPVQARLDAAVKEFTRWDKQLDFLLRHEIPVLPLPKQAYNFNYSTNIANPFNGITKSPDESE